MRKIRIDEDAFAELGRLADGGDEQQQDPRHLKEYRPLMGPAQARLYDSTAKYALAYGERFSGKSHIGGGHKLVRHLWRNFNALAIVLVGVKNQAMKGGIWEKLQLMILPEWAEGQGLVFSEEKRDDQKNPYIEVTNRFGGWSRVVLVSAPLGEMLRKRIRGYEASYIFVEELTTLDGSAFFDAVTQQVGRRPGIDDVQQYVAATNPEGPSHWVYQRWFVTPLDPETGEYNPDYLKVHLPSSENPIRESANPKERKLFDEYMRTVMDACANDPIAERRMMRGEWVDRPSGEAIFKDYYLPALHLKGDLKQRILPVPQWPVAVGWDPGISFNSIVFEQYLPINGRMTWVIFDEMVYLGRRLRQDVLVPAVMRRLRWWQRHVGRLIWDHISDDSAFNQFRPNSGSYDVMDIERESRKVAARWMVKKPDGTEGFEVDPIKMRPGPKFHGSREARVRLLMNLLQREEIFISPACKNVTDSLLHLESEKQKEGAKYDPSLAFSPKRSKYLHTFDAMTYPMLSLDVKRSRTVSTGSTMELHAFGS